MKIKRFFDLFICIICIVLLSVPFAILCIMIRSKIGAPILFMQDRPGLHGVPFKMVKFRTMTNELGSDSQLLPDAQRLTAFGRWLRATSLDELPELWNVIKGEMSLVGPRPLLIQYLELYSPYQARRHEVKPGITGWAQINGRNSISWEQKFQLDVWYVENQSLWIDIKILWMTIKKVLIKDGISATGEATMTAFTGNKEIQQTEQSK